MSTQTRPLCAAKIIHAPRMHHGPRSLHLWLRGYQRFALSSLGSLPANLRAAREMKRKNPPVAVLKMGE